MGRLISERDVRAAARSGQGLRTGPRDIITPAARDLAHQLGVTLQASPAEQHVTPRPASTRIVAIGADHGGFALKEKLKDVIAGLGFTVRDLGCVSAEPVDYPVFAARVADAVAEGVACFGVIVDGAGVGSAMVANKTAGVRAACCSDVTTAANAREHNSANVLTLGAGLIGERLAAEILRVFLTTEFGGGRHARRVAMIDALDGARAPVHHARP
jgi:ribose 5-phosphate isomerase B